MPDYMYIPKVIDTYTQGTVVMSRDGIGDYKTGYIADSQYEIRLGLYKRGTNLYFVYASNSAINDIEIELIIPSSEVVFTLNSVTNSFTTGYYVETPYTIIPDSTAVTVFNSLNEVLDAMSYPAPPGSDSGVVVTIIGAPVDTPPTQVGVEVYITGRLLDPNQQGGTSDIGGGHGTFDDTSDPIPYPLLPTLSAADAGLITLFRPEKNALQALGRVLWTNISDFIENLNKIFVNPMDYIVSLNIFPCVPDVGESREINIGSWTSNIYMPPVLSQWYEHNCGTIRINEYWGSALDYAPNTKVSLFLPFIGSVELNTDEVMGHALTIKYNVDLMSGQCVAMVAIDNSVWYQFTGECSISIPLTASDWSRVYTAAIGAVGTAITGGIGAAYAGAAAGGATAALAGARASEAISMAGQNFAMLNETSKGIRGVQEMRGRMLEAAEIASNAAKQAAAAPTQVGAGIRASRIANAVNNTVGHVMSGKGHVQHSGSISGSAGMLGIKTPYIIIEFPNQSLADNYKHFVGYPSNISGKLSTFSGYTECEQVIPTGFTGTDDELAELLEALKGGVYL